MIITPPTARGPVRCIAAFALLASFQLLPRQAAASVYDVPPSPLPATLQSGDTLNIHSGEQEIPSSAPGTSYLPAGGVVNLYGGSLTAPGPDSYFAASGSQVNVYGGTLDFNKLSGELNIYDGIISQGVTTESRVWIGGGDSEMYHFKSEILISGGAVVVDMAQSNTVATGGNLSRVRLSDGSSLTILGGEHGVGDTGFLAEYISADSTLTLAGGRLLPLTRVVGNEHLFVDGLASAVFGEGTLSFIGSQFAVNGVLLNNLENDEPFAVDERNVVLSGVLNDGTPFRYPLATPFNPAFDLTYQVIQVPEPWSVAHIGFTATCLLGGRVRGRR